MAVTESRILDLIADACKRERTPGCGGAAWTFLHMTEQERLAFDLFLVRTGDSLAFEPGTTEYRFRERIRRMVAPFPSTASSTE
jgi:hypothetical protein